MGELKRFDVEMNGDDLIIDEAPDGDWVKYADVERLRAELDDESAERHEAESRECTLKGSLAAANTLLGRCRAGFDWNQYDNAEQNQIGRDLNDWHRAHLAAQPATDAGTLKPLALVEDRTPEQLAADGDAAPGWFYNDGDGHK